jgi:uncharacterized protein YyaL (SSP411 family)
MTVSGTKHSNRLAREKSPYLLQHAHNPVDWFAWGPEAFAAARAGNKPVFLSIGYSTCHWCHVMERESFEDEKIAAFLNAHFVSIKVDREERPDVDKIYMTFVQATTGSGGWPLNVFLTPELKPFFGGTYFPPDNRHGRPSFLQLLQRIQELWDARRDDLVASADDAHAKLRAYSMTEEASEAGLSAETLRAAAQQLKRFYDPRNGGFGGAPKFPQPSQPQLLLRCARRFGDVEAATMVLHTCERMAAGGIHDQLGGGFARYSVDAEWLVPHFEKMLYDNAQLAQLYLDAYLVAGEDKFQVPGSRFQGKAGLAELVPPNVERFAGVVRDILGYVLRDMTHPDGGFFSAEDADSEGHEGKFYCWTRSELEKLLAPEEFNVAVRYFGITEQGNFIDHSHPQPLAGQNVLSIVEPLAPEQPEDAALLASARKKMMDVRNRRVRPHRDDKVLASWNGLMLGAMARAYAVLGDEVFLGAARKNAAFLRARLWEPAANGGVGTLYHRWRDGERDEVQLLEGYAFLLSGMIELYEATLDPAHLEFAIALAEAMLKKFYDADGGGFWQSPAEVGDLILRVKDDYDGAEPSGNSVATLALLKLGAISGREAFTQAAEKTLRLFAVRMEQTPQAVPFMLQALDFWLQPPKRAVAVGNREQILPLVRALHGIFQPNKVVLGTAGPVEPFARSLPAKNGATVYLCSGTACQEPTADPVLLKENLR